MVRFANLTLAGITSGAVFAAVALALVLIWRATRIVNFAQGGMLMFTTFLGWSVIDHGGSYWLALGVALWRPGWCSARSSSGWWCGRSRTSRR